LIASASFSGSRSFVTGWRLKDSEMSLKPLEIL